MSKQANARIRTCEEREETGRSLRQKCPRASHSKVILGKGKRDVVALIEGSNAGRIENLVPIRHGRMLQSPFAYFRGTALVQAHDLAGTPASGISVHSCGDCHLVNFGGFATPERNLVFDINDFDETLPAPFEWDLKRLASSFVLAARWRGFRAGEAREVAVRAAGSYRESMRARAGRGVLEAWYDRITIQEVQKMAPDAEAGARLKKNVAAARKRTNEYLFQKLTVPKNGLPRIVDQPPLLYHPDRLKVGRTTMRMDQVLSEQALANFFHQYRKTLAEERRIMFDRFKLVDVAMKVVGVGSVGTACFVVLLLAAPDDPLFLQVKEARPSVLERYTKHAPVPQNGQRVVIGQRLMQAASDIFLGWSRGPNGRDFYVRQLRDVKIAPDVDSMSPKVMLSYATLCALALARAHDKAGDAALIAGYLGRSDKFDEAIGDYAVAYADQVERDYESFAKAVRNGRLKTDLSASRLATMLR